jgi:hypothetical protein
MLTFVKKLMLLPTFKEMGIFFNGSGCQTCGEDFSCHNIVVCKKNNQEYSVHISTDEDFNNVNIICSISPNSSSEHDIERFFQTQSEAVTFLKEHFSEFKCA